MKTRDNDDTRRHRVEAQLALALTRAEPAPPCPGAEELAAWHEGRLDLRQREGIADHLGHCSRCYELWSMLAETEALPAEDAAKVSRKPASRPGLLARWRDWLRSAGRGWLYTGGLGGALAAALVVLVLLPALEQGPGGRFIDEGYRALRGREAGFPEQWPLAGGSNYGVKSLFDRPARARSADDPAALAFAGGVRAGIGTLLPETPYWQERLAELPTGTAAQELPGELRKLLEALGRWAVLLHAACGQEDPAALPADFWSSQLQALADLAAACSRWQDGAESGAILGQLLRLRSMGLFLEAWAADARDAGAGPEAARELLCARADVLLRVGLEP